MQQPRMVALSRSWEILLMYYCDRTLRYAKPATLTASGIVDPKGSSAIGQGCGYELKSLHLKPDYKLNIPTYNCLAIWSTINM
jgi:hypothetical protein